MASAVLGASPVWSYVDFKVQRYFPQSGDLEGATAGSGVPGMAIDLGGPLRGPVGAELSVGWFTVDIPTSALDGPQETSLLVMPVTLSGFVEARVGVCGLYALAGPGLYGTTSFRGLDAEDSITHGFQLGAGFWVAHLGIEGRYIFASPRVFESNCSIQGTVIGLYWTLR